MVRRIQIGVAAILAVTTLLYSFRETATATLDDRVSILRQGKFSIENLVFNSYANSSDTDTSKCVDWQLSQKELKDILKNSVVLDGAEWHYLYDVLRCQGKFTLTNKKGVLCRATINAGSWIRLQYSDTTILLGDTLSEHKMYFISSASNE